LLSDAERFHIALGTDYETLSPKKLRQAVYPSPSCAGHAHG
jgi:hypothetical protein